MKTIKMFLFFCLASMVLIPGCIMDVGPVISGNGNVVTKERQVAPFTVLKVASGIDVYLTQGDQEALIVEADENLHDVIITEVSDGVLKVYTKYLIPQWKSKIVHLTFKELSSIRISSAGDVVGTNSIKADDININLSSAGDLKLDLLAKRIDIDISSSGNATLSGTTSVLDANLSSAGDLNAFDLVAERCRVRVSSAGDAWVNATSELDMGSSSAGDIVYTGDATITHMNTSSAGTIIKK
jgi:hypothetical protein